jgi:uncharacterized membrane-anchored protein
MRRSLLALAVVLPLVVLAFAMIRAERHLGENRRWSFEVTGFDPRDLLRGHYLQFRVVLDEPDAASARELESCSDDSCCLCLLAADADTTTKVQHTTCEAARESCDGALRESSIVALQRYYIPEERAAEISKLFEQARGEHRARLVVTVDEAAEAHIDTLLVDDIPVERAR